MTTTAAIGRPGAGVEAPIAIRPIEPGDADALLRFHARCSEHTHYLRFFSPHPSLSDEEVEWFTHVDHRVREAMVAETGGEIVGVARYDRLPGTDDGEVAFVVEDGWQGHRLGTRLFAALADRAREESLRGFVAETLPHNARMLRLFRSTGTIVSTAYDGGEVRVVMDLARSATHAGPVATGAGPSALPPTRPIGDHRPMQVDRNGLEVLGPEECRALLSTATLGRVAITSGALPVVLPVHFRVADGHVVFRTGRGTKLDAATENAVVAFEVDEIDPTYHTGWSVVVTGVAREVRDPASLPPEARTVPRWIAGDGHGDRFVAVSIDVITGRRVLPTTASEG